MVEITSAFNTPRRAGIRPIKKHSLRTDMTPMVDLGFLLITFFVFTAEMSKPTVTKLVMPKDDQNHPTPVGESNAVTVLLSGNNIAYYYEGKWTEALQKNTVYQTSLSYRNGIGDIIRQKQLRLDADPTSKEGKDGLMLIIKPSADASYSNVIDMLDEAMINKVKKYVMVSPAAEENKWLLQKIINP